MNDYNSIFADIDMDHNHVPELHQLNNYLNNTQYFSIDSFNEMLVDGVDLKVLHLNIRSLCSNMEDLCALLSLLNCKFDAICITESWLDDYTEPLYSLPGYQVFHSLRPVGMRGGGISVFVLDGYEVTVLNHYTISSPTIESLFLKINHSKANKNFVLGTAYKPPSINCEIFTDALCNIISGLYIRGGELILCGDFNIDLFAIDTLVPTAEFVNRLFSLSLTPVITKPTRVTDHSATLIDNIFINDALDYRAGILSSDISDHFPIFLIKRLF